MAYTPLTKAEIKKHSIIWLLITIFLLIIDHGDASIFMEVFVQILITLRYMFAYYALSGYIFPEFYRVNNIKLVVSFLIVYILYELINHVTFFDIMTMFGDEGVYDDTPFYEWLLNSSIFFFIIAIVSFGAYQNKTIRIEIQNQNEKEKALLIKELGFFKNQFNSHIIFNFLNYCYSYVQSSNEAALAIELFSEMLRYVMTTKPDEPVPLKREIEHINQFIRLHKQLSSGICIQFDLKGDLNGKSILPCILITFVENAFKHGVIHSAETPILIHLQSDKNDIKFKVINKKNYQRNLPSTGIGHYNLKQQLELFYNKKHELIINHDKETYCCELILTV